MLKRYFIQALCWNTAGSVFRAGCRPANAVNHSPTSLYHQFEQQALIAPERLAVRGPRHSFTYAELADSALRTARIILREPPTADSPIALLFSHDALSAAAQLGVYAAGRVCVPLDPDFPRKRLAQILEQAGTELLLCDTRHLPLARMLASGGSSSIRCVCVNGEDPPPQVVPPAGAPAQSGTACIIFTSGSTGRPKGVCQNHRTIIHDVRAMSLLHQIGPHDRIAVLSPASAIAGMTALFGALLNGASAHYFDVRASGPADLAAWLMSEEITFYQSVSTLFRRFLNAAAEPARFERIRVVRLVGEPVTQTEWRLWRKRFPKQSILETGLGSSEACMATRWIADQATCWEDAVLPAGGALPDKNILIVDESGLPAATGTPGEILVSSEYLFDGYWHSPELTSAVLTSTKDGSPCRTLRTGDLGKLLPDGTLMHLGRRDGQVKVRGNRVEIAEVEAALRELDAVRDAAAVTVEAATGDNRLAAFVVTETDVRTEERKLRARLRELLPSYMVPDSIAVLKELPILPGGKIDRVALASRAKKSCEAHAGASPPESPVEEIVSSIFEDVLDRTGIGRGEHLFLDLGADSLAAVQIAGTVSEVFGLQMQPEDLAHDPTVKSLAGRLSTGDRQTRSHLLLHPHGDRAPLHAFCGAFGSALRLLAVALRLGEHQPFIGLQPPGMDWAGVGADSLEEMAAHYASEILHLQNRGPYRLLGTSFGGIFAFEIACRLRELGEQVELLAMVDTFPPDCMVGGLLNRAERRDWTDGAPTDSPLAVAGVRVARQHLAAFDRFRLTRRFDGTILYFRCTDPPAPAETDRRLLWQHFAAGVKIIDVPGFHGHFHEEPQLSAILTSLRAALRTA